MVLQGFTITFCLLFTFVPEIRSYTFHRNKRQDLTLEQTLDRFSAQKQMQGQNLSNRPNQWSSISQELHVGNFVNGLDPGFSSKQELTNGQNLAVNNFQENWNVPSSNNGFTNSMQTGSSSDGQVSNNGFSNAIQKENGISNNQYGSENNQGGYGSSQVGNMGLQWPNSYTTQRPPFNMISNQNSINEQITVCIRNCPSTIQYNPICGNDNITYENEGKLNCARKCNRQVSVAYHGACVTVTSAP